MVYPSSPQRLPALNRVRRDAKLPRTKSKATASHPRFCPGDFAGGSASLLDEGIEGSSWLQSKLDFEGCDVRERANDPAVREENSNDISASVYLERAGTDVTVSTI